ncbi:hypothetical protein D3C79_658280 [compost metagenome]
MLQPAEFGHVAVGWRVGGTERRGRRLVGPVADHCDSGGARQRQQRLASSGIGVAQQHDAFTCSVQRGALTVLGVLQRLCRVEVFLEVVADHRTQVALDLVVDDVLGQLAAPQVRQQVGLGELQARRHVQVGAGPCALERVVNGIEVTDNGALIAPLAFEHLGDQVVVFTGVVAVDLVEPAHDRRHVGVLDHRLEAGQVQLTQRALIGHDIDRLAIGFLLIGQVMLATGLDPLGLDAVDDGRRQHRAKERVLATDVLGRTAVVGRAVQIHPGREHLLAAGNTRFIGNGQAELFGPVDAPGGGQGRLRRILCAKGGVIDVHAHGRVVSHRALDTPLEQRRDHVAIVDPGEVDLLGLVHVVQDGADPGLHLVAGGRPGRQSARGLHDAERHQAHGLFEMFHGLNPQEQNGSRQTCGLTAG